MLSPEVVARAPQIRQEFQQARPFRHVVIDNFLDASRCEALLRDFPAFEDRNAMNEFGRVGQKAVVEQVSQISPFYAEFYRYINSTGFLAAMSELTGIPQLLADATLFGGGTHENLHGQSLDNHVDFNIDERRMLHRRVNLLIYLNREWDESWGGAIELHSDPRNPQLDEYRSILPLFNRAVLFETNEYSWHGFRTIRLPADKRHLSRKSFSIYLYTRERPVDEVVAPHTTFYVPQPLPSHIRAGHTLTPADCDEIERLMQRRTHLLEMYQKLLIEKEQRLHDLMRASRAVPAGLPSSARSLLMRLRRLAGRVRNARDRDSLRRDLVD
jgi:Rps23 Pro-64 3,4-dihydroxylase Tpa1-like proline 4-hydroxylase